MSIRLLQGDCLELLRDMPDKSVDLVFCSPPYEDRRLYGPLGFRLVGQDWVDWAIERYAECYRVCRGLTAWVVEGKTSKFQWSATPALLQADLHRRGVKLRKAPAYYRVGIPGSGGPDWLRNDYETIICASHGRLPWSDNTAAGKACKYGPGGVMSHRLQDGVRVNVAKMRRLVESGVAQREAARLTGVPFKVSTSGTDADGTVVVDTYIPPEKANPGNLVQETYTAQEVAAMLDLYESGDTRHYAVGGGKIGSTLAHETDAPFPEKLAEFFIRSFCPPGGTVLDPFLGSGTTVCVAKQLGRSAIGIDIRTDQLLLTKKRLLDPRYNP